MLHLGLSILVVGMIALALTVEHSGVDVSAWAMAPGTLIAGVGCGLIFPPLFDLILADLDDNEVGSGQACSTPSSSSAERPASRRSARSSSSCCPTAATPTRSAS